MRLGVGERFRLGEELDVVGGLGRVALAKVSKQMLASLKRAAVEFTVCAYVN